MNPRGMRVCSQIIYRLSCQVIHEVLLNLNLFVIFKNSKYCLIVPPFIPMEGLVHSLQCPLSLALSPEAELPFCLSMSRITQALKDIGAGIVVLHNQLILFLRWGGSDYHTSNLASLETELGNVRD